MKPATARLHAISTSACRWGSCTHKRLAGCPWAQTLSDRLGAEGAGEEGERAQAAGESCSGATPERPQTPAASSELRRVTGSRPEEGNTLGNARTSAAAAPGTRAAPLALAGVREGPGPPGPQDPSPGCRAGRGQQSRRAHGRARGLIPRHVTPLPAPAPARAADNPATETRSQPGPRRVLPFGGDLGTWSCDAFSPELGRETLQRSGGTQPAPQELLQPQQVVTDHSGQRGRCGGPECPCSDPRQAQADCC